MKLNLLMIGSLMCLGGCQASPDGPTGTSQDGVGGNIPGHSNTVGLIGLCAEGECVHGTGVLLGPERAEILTAAHVAASLESVLGLGIDFGRDSQNREQKANLGKSYKIFFHPSVTQAVKERWRSEPFVPSDQAFVADLAIIKLPAAPSDFRFDQDRLLDTSRYAPLSIADHAPEPGTPVLADGTHDSLGNYIFALDGRSGAVQTQMTVATRKDLYLYHGAITNRSDDFFGCEAPLDRGDSGGPAYDLNNASSSTSSVTLYGINAEVFCYPAQQVQTDSGAEAVVRGYAPALAEQVLALSPEEASNQGVVFVGMTRLDDDSLWQGIPTRTWIESVGANCNWEMSQEHCMDVTRCIGKHWSHVGGQCAPSCGYLAADLYGWKILHTPSAADYPDVHMDQWADYPLPPDELTSLMLNYSYPSGTNYKLDRWIATHGWRLACDHGDGVTMTDADGKTIEHVNLSNQPGWIRLDGLKSDTSFPGSSPAENTYDCAAGCYLWRGEL